MKLGLVIFGLLCSPFAQATVFEVVPLAETRALCTEKGYIGEFVLNQDGEESWVAKFASGKKLYFKKVEKDIYHNEIECVMGCSGYAEWSLNFKAKEFYYWNSVDRKPEVCKGLIKARK
jgi:hypothetical protein